MNIFLNNYNNFFLHYKLNLLFYKLFITRLRKYRFDFTLCILDVSRNADLNWAQDSLGLLEDQCEIEATYRRSTDWAKDFLGRLVLPPVIVEVCLIFQNSQTILFILPSLL